MPEHKDDFRTRPANKNYRDNYDKIFRKPERSKMKLTDTERALIVQEIASKLAISTNAVISIIDGDQDGADPYTIEQSVKLPAAVIDKVRKFWLELSTHQEKPAPAPAYLPEKTDLR